MKEIFEQLKQRLLDCSDHYVFDDVDGNTQFDGEAMFSVIDGFADEFEKGLQ